MADINELYGLLKQADAAAQAGDTNAIADVQALLGEIDRLQVAPAQQSVMEDPGKLAAPIGGGDGVMPEYRTQPESDKVALKTPQLTREFLSDYKIVTGSPVPLSARTPEEALDAAMAAGTLDPSFVPNERFGAFASQWTPYLAERQSTIGGALARGARSAIGTTVGGGVGAGVGQLAGIPAGAAIGFGLAGPPGAAIGAEIGGVGGALAGGFVGGMLGDLIQDKSEDALGLRSDADRAQDRLDQDRAATRWARMVGEVGPQLAMPGSFGGSALATGPIKAALAGERAAQIGLGIGAGIGAAAPITIDAINKEPIDFERVTMGLLTGLILQPKSNAYFDRAARTKIAAIQARNATVEQMATNPLSALNELQNARDLNARGVQIGSGVLSDDSGLIMLENALAVEGPQIQAARMATERAIPENLARDLETVGPSPSVTKEFFADQMGRRDALAQGQYQRTLAVGNAAEAALLNDALVASQNAQLLVNNNLLSAEQALAISNRNYNDAIRAIRDMRGTREIPSKTVLNVLQENKAVEKTAVENMATFNGAGVFSDFANYQSALAQAKSEVSPSITLPGQVQSIIDRYKPKKDPKTKKVAQPKIDLATMVNDVSLISDEMRTANQDGKTQIVKYLKLLKNGIEKDIDASANTEKLRAFKNAYYEYARKFLNEDSLDVLVTKSTDPAKVIDHYMRTTGKVEGTAGAQQLRDAIQDNPAALQAIEDWFVNQMAEKGGQNPTSAQLRTWLTSNETQERLRIFPSAEAKPLSLINQLDVQESMLELRKTQQKAAEVAAKKPDSTEANRLSALATEVKTATEKQAQEALKKEQQLIEQHAAQKFLNQRPFDAVASVFSQTAKDPLVTMQSLIELAKKDPSGEAFEGLKNAVRDYVDKEIRGSKVVGSTSKPGELTTKDWNTTLAKLKRFTEPDSNELLLLEQVFGSKSKEVAGLQLAAAQLAVLGRTFRASSGQSATTFLKAGLEEVTKSAEFNSLDFLARMARGFDIRKASSAPGYIGRLTDLIQLAWSGDVKSEAIKSLQDAILDPDKMILALRDLRNPSDLPAVRSWLKLYGVPYAFDPSSSKEETIGTGAVVTDTEYGYRLTTRDNKRYKVFYPNGNLLGIYESKEAAQNAADKDILKARKLK